MIHCRRSARDTALSIWLENFGIEQRYATDFGDLAFFVAQYERLMAHWRRALPLRILEVQCEETVAALERQARRLIAFLGVPWDARCLEFHRSQRAVQTPSRWQVRQPIYSRSVGRYLGDRLPWTGTAADIFVQAQFPLHSGRILGLPGRILVSIMGLVVAALSVTGVVVWHRKRAARLQRRSRTAAPIAQIRIPAE